MWEALQILRHFGVEGLGRWETSGSGRIEEVGDIREWKASGRVIL